LANLQSSTVADRARRRIALRLLPYLFILYIVAFLDRTNISSAALEIPHELGFSDNIIGVGSGIFFIGYLVLEIPGAVIVERWSARRWIARIMVTWGLVTVWMACIHTPRQFYTVRFLLGAAEAGFFPGIIVYLTHWFTPQDRAKAVANFMAAIPISQVVGAPIAGWLLGVHWHGLSGWRWLFILEGIPAVIFGVVTYFYLTDRPHQAHWLPAEEQEWIITQLENEKQTKKFSSSTSFLRAMVHREVITLTFIYFVQIVAAFAFLFWLPVMVKRLSGLSNSKVLMISSYDGEEDIYRAFQAGARGYVIKDVEGKELFRAIKVVHAGERYVPAYIAHRLSEHSPDSDLTQRELEVLQLLIKGLSNKEIGSLLGCTENTTKFHVKNILAKLQVSDRTEAATAAFHRGILR